jgi:tRNA A37 threonylcarbamoyladenosine dehydratase
VYPAKLAEIWAFDHEKKKIGFIQNVDYFIDCLGRVYCISNNLKMKNINKIEVISSEKSSKKFYVSDYLSDYE